MKVLLFVPYPPVFHPVGVVPAESSTQEFVMRLVGDGGTIPESIFIIRFAVALFPLMSFTLYGMVVVQLKFSTGVNTTSPLVVFAVQVHSGFMRTF